MDKLRIFIAVSVAAALVSTCAAATSSPVMENAELELQGLVSEIENVLPQSWRIIESGVGELPLGWTGPESGLYVMVEDTNTRFLHASGFHYYSFYRIWLMPSGWEGEMRHTPYIADSAPAFLLGLSSDHVALYHTAGGNVWDDGPAQFCSVLGLDTIRYTDLMRRVVDLDIEERLTHAVPVAGDRACELSQHSKASLFQMNPYRIVGLAGDGAGLYLEYVFGNEEDPDESQLEDLTEQLAGSVFQTFPEVESLYLRRCTRDTFTDTIVNRD